jgi:hypothetical protein
MGDIIFRRKNSTTGGFFPRWYTQMDVPEALQGRIGQKRLTASTGETDERRARPIAERTRAGWRAQFAAARNLGSGPIATVENVTAAISEWRRAECLVAAGFEKRVEEAEAHRFRTEVMPQAARWGVAVIYGLPVPDLDEPETSPVQPNALAWARAYFNDERGQVQPRDVGLPYSVGMILARLQTAARERDGWAESL